MKALNLLAAAFLALSFIGIAPAYSQSFTDGFYQIGPAAYTDGTSADRFLPEVPGQYQFDYGEDGSVTFILPWPFSYYGQSYNQITADTDGNLWFGGTSGSGAVVRAWNADLNSYFSGGVFVQSFNTPDRVVVQWKSETFATSGTGELNDVAAVLFANGDLLIVYNDFASPTLEDHGSGVFSSIGGYHLNLTALYGDVPTLGGSAYLVSIDTLADADNDGLPNDWELNYGLDPLLAADADADTDGDGLTNLQEYLSGSSPILADRSTDDISRGTATVTGAWDLITPTGSHQAPVVIVGAPTYLDPEPGVLRVTNVLGSGFNLRFQE